jgi:hypothetical protein
VPFVCVDGCAAAAGGVLLLQLLLQDLKTGVCPAHEVACLVMDECHRWAPVFNTL